MVVFKYVKCKGSEYVTSKHAIWHSDYFELKVLEKQPVQEGHSDAPLSSWQQGINLPCERYPLCTRKLEANLPPETENSGPRKLCKQTLSLLHHVTTFSPNLFVLSILHNFVVSLSKRYKSFLL